MLRLLEQREDSNIFRREKDINVSPSTVHRVLKAFGLIEKTKSIKQKRKQNQNRKRTKTGLRTTGMPRIRAPGEIIQQACHAINKCQCGKSYKDYRGRVMVYRRNRVSTSK